MNHHRDLKCEKKVRERSVKGLRNARAMPIHWQEIVCLQKRQYLLPPDLKSSSKLSLPFAWITGPATNPSFRKNVIVNWSSKLYKINLNFNYFRQVWRIQTNLDKSESNARSLEDNNCQHLAADRNGTDESPQGSERHRIRNRGIAMMHSKQYRELQVIPPVDLH